MAESVRRGNEGESSSGGRGAIVVKENQAWRGRKLDPQDAGQVETHLASRAPEGSEKIKPCSKRQFLSRVCSVSEETGEDALCTR